jgi:hypothetical protein
VDSARVILPGDITEEQIQKMIENSWNVYNDNGDYVYTHSGYNMATEYSVTFIRLPNEAALIFELANTADELSSVKAERDALIKQVDDLSTQLEEAKSANVVIPEEQAQLTGIVGLT